METHARYFLIGAFSLIVTLVLVFFVLWLGKLQLRQAYQDYDIRFHESVSGLAVGASVQFHGLQVGEVRKLSLDPNDPREISVIVRVGADAPIKTDTKAQLSYTGLTGVAVVELFDGKPETQFLRDVDSHAIPRIQAVPSNLGQLLSGSRGAVTGAQDVLSRLADLLNQENAENVAKTLQNIEEITRLAKADYPKFSRVLADAQHLETQLRGIADRANSVLSQVQEAMGAESASESKNIFAKARTTMSEIDKAALAVTNFAEQWRGTMQGFDAKERQKIAEILESLGVASANLARISQRFDQAPLDYVLKRETLPEYKPEATKQ